MAMMEEPETGGAPVAIESEPEAPAEQPWSLDPAEWQATQERLEEIAQVVRPQPQYQSQDQGPPVPDPFADDYAQQVAVREAWLLQPLRQIQYEMTQAEGRESAMAFFERDAAANGAFDAERAWGQAQYMVMSGQVAPPQNERESQQILAESAKQLREYDRRVGEAYHQQQIQQVQAVAGAPRQIPAGATAAQIVETGGLGAGPNAVTDFFFRRDNR